MRPLIFLASGVLALAAVAAQAAPITYSFNQTVGSANAYGTITTNGKIGSLSTSDITSFSLTLKDNNSTVMSDSTGAEYVDGTNGLTATSSGLFFNYSDSANDYFILYANSQRYNGSLVSNYLCFVSAGNSCSGNGSSNTEIRVSTVGYTSSTLQANQQIGTAISQTPEPSSFALLGTGLVGTLGVVRRRFIS